MKTIKVYYNVKNNIFEDGQINAVELPISADTYKWLLNKNTVVKQTLVNTIVNIARLQGFQYAEITEIHY